MGAPPETMLVRLVRSLPGRSGWSRISRMNRGMVGRWVALWSWMAFMMASGPGSGTRTRVQPYWIDSLRATVIP